MRGHVHYGYVTIPSTIAEISLLVYLLAIGVRRASLTGSTGRVSAPRIPRRPISWIRTESGPASTRSGWFPKALGVVLIAGGACYVGPGVGRSGRTRPGGSR